MNKDMDAQFLCKDCARYNLCKYYDRRKEDSYICKYFHLSENPNKGDTISRGTFEQVRWERDIAIQQLKDLGYALGEKPKECKGKWLDDGFCGDYVCSVCKQEFDCDIVNMRGFDSDLPKFCPNCGARMKGSAI